MTARQALKTQARPRKPSEFQKWFKAQFGALPNANERLALRERIKSLKVNLFTAEFQLQIEDELAAKHQAALYVWSMRGKR